MEIYIDLAIFLNFTVDFLLLLGTNRLAGFPCAYGRCLLSAAFGSLYSGLCLVPGFRFLSHPVWYLLSLGVMAVIAFGFRDTALRRGAVFLLLALSLGGMALAFHRSQLPLLLLEAGALWLLTGAAFGNSRIGAEYLPVTVRKEGKDISFTALRDTGNQLKDPVTGQSVLVVSPGQAQRLTGLTLDQITHPLETMLDPPIPGLRLIPYCAVGSSGNMLLALQFSSVTIGSHTDSRLIAFAPEGLGITGMAEALAGGSLC